MIIVSPEEIVIVAPNDLITTSGSNVTFNAETDAGPDTTYFWIFDPDFSICIDGNIVCEDFANG